jgi:hypothetical protein
MLKPEKMVQKERRRDKRDKLTVDAKDPPTQSHITYCLVCS